MYVRMHTHMYTRTTINCIYTDQATCVFAKFNSGSEYTTTQRTDDTGNNMACHDPLQLAHTLIH